VDGLERLRAAIPDAARDAAAVALEAGETGARDPSVIEVAIQGA
jgi:hypothetical protein